MKGAKKLVWVLVIVVFFLGACLAGAGVALGGQLHDGFGLHYTSDKNPYRSSNETKLHQLESFSSLDMDIAFGDIEIIEGDSFELEIKNIPEESYTIEMKDGTLHITSRMKEHKGYSLFSGFQNLNYKLTLRIPVEGEYESFLLHASMGDISLNNIITKNLQITQDMGDVHVEDVEVRGDSTIINRMGDIKFYGSSLGGLRVNNEMGDIKLVLQGSEEEYSYDLSTSMGDVKINGETMSDGLGGHVSGGVQKAPYHIEADGSMGDIKLEFLK